MTTDPDAWIKAKFDKHKDELFCRVCGKRGIRYFPTGPNDNITWELGGWCSIECFEAEIEDS